MSAERENYASRRAILTGAPALALVAAMPVANATPASVVASADPYVSLAAEWHAQRASIEAAFDQPDVDAAYARWIGTEDKMTVTRATTIPGALAGLRIAHSEFLEHFGGDSSPGGKFVGALILSAIAVLERETANV